uniref:Alkyl hydroperoxide reductase subunit C/ Thiol specific antioxidant domain-containing protein n=1 Tax=Hucho hucho TaxID=62062 RepID=A0A4W5P916_9TELE
MKHRSQGDRGCHSSTRPLLSLSRCFCPSIHHHPPLSVAGVSCSPISVTTPVCTTELGRAPKLSGEFSRSNIKMIALSIDSLEDHRGWTEVSTASQMESGCAFLFPIIADSHRKLAVALGMLDHGEKDKCGIPLTATDFFIGPDKRLKLSLLYPPTMARNFDEILRVVEGLQLTAQNQVATPPGDYVRVPPNIPEEAAAINVKNNYAFLRLSPDPLYQRDSSTPPIRPLW